MESKEFKESQHAFDEEPVYTEAQRSYYIKRCFELGHPVDPRQTLSDWEDDDEEDEEGVPFGQHVGAAELRRKNPDLEEAVASWQRLTKSEDCDQLMKKEIKIWTKKGITPKKLFSRVGPIFLGWAVSLPTSSYFESTCNNVGMEIVKIALYQDGFYAVDFFLMMESGRELMRTLTKKELDARKSKFALLLELAPEEMPILVERYESKAKLGDGVKISFKEAMEEYNKTKQVS